MKTSIPILAAFLVVGATHLHAATLTVTSTADSGAGSLRAALASAANGDTINATGVSGTILLTSGELLVTKSLTILGPGPASLTVDGNFPNTTNRVFHIGPGIIASISGLTVTKGYARGATPASFGGGIYNDGATLTVSNCTLSGNSTTYGGEGGGIYNNHATLTVSNCILSDNSAGFGGGIRSIGRLTGSAAIVRIANSTLTWNYCDAFGGGVYNEGASGGSASLEVVNSTLSPNYANNGIGGGICSIGRNKDGAATVRVANSIISDSVGGGGGGIFNSGRDGGSASLEVADSTVSGNYSGYGGGGILNEGWLGGTTTVLVANSTLSSNVSDAFSLGSGHPSGGGGVRNSCASAAGTATFTIVNIVNSTLSGNSATNGGGIWNGGPTFGSARATVVNSTLSDNWATDGSDGIGNSGGNASLEIGSSILNAGASGVNITNSSGTVISDGYNLSSDNGGGFLTGTADQINTDPKLGPLQDNGGPTFTHALLPGSPAIDKGKNLSASATDQRGQPRQFDDPDIANDSGGDGTDIGAYEMINLRITSVQKAGNDLQLSFTSGAGGKYVVQSRSNLLTGAWAALPGTNTGTGVIVQIVETNAFAVPEQFYRIHQLP